MLIVSEKTAALITLLIIGISASFTSATFSVGVKKGDWIEYQVSTSGELDSAHSISGAKMEIISVQGFVIQVTITSTYSNGTKVVTNSTLNLQTGELIDNFIIPAGLTTNDQFYDAQAKSNVTITETYQQLYAGALRTIVKADVNTTNGHNVYIWDQSTGISVEGISEGSDYTIHSLAIATNIWRSQNEGSVPISSYVAIAVAAVVTMILVLFLFLRRRRKL